MNRTDMYRALFLPPHKIFSKLSYQALWFQIIHLDREPHRVQGRIQNFEKGGPIKK